MRSHPNKTRIIITILILLLFGGAGIWFFLGINRIISAVPNDSGNSQRVILVTPRATPTSEFEPTPTLTEQEQSVLDEEDPTPTTKPEEEATPTTKEGETPTPTNTE